MDLVPASRTPSGAPSRTAERLAHRRVSVGGILGKRARSWIGFAALAFFLSLISHLPLATAPFGQGVADVNSGRYQGGIQRAYDKLGFWELRGAPHVSPLPTKTVPSTAVPSRVYLNHPPLLNWANRVGVLLFGYTELGLRAYPILCCAILAAILAWFAAVHAGAIAAVATALLYAALPMTTIYGSSSNWESPTLLYSVLAMLYLASRSRRRRRWGFLWLAIAVLHDWVGVFTLVGLVLYRYGSGRRQRIGPLVAGALTCAVCIGLFLALGAYWAGGLRAAIGIILESASSAASGQIDYSLGGFVSAQVSHTLGQFGWLPILLATAAIPWAVVRGRRGGNPMGGMILCWTAVAVLYVCAFPGRAINHDLWWYSYTPAVVMATAVAVSASWKIGLRIASMIGLGAVLVTALVPSMRFYGGVTSNSKDFGEILNAQFDERAIVVAPFAGRPYYFYTDAWLVDVSCTPEIMRELVRQFRLGNLDADRLVFLTDPRSPLHDDVVRLAPELGMDRPNLGVGEVQVFELRSDAGAHK